MVTPLKPRHNNLWQNESLKTLKMSMFFKTGRHFVRHEFILYDWDSLIADMGGYLGLLLGHSMLSLFYQMSGWLQMKE